MASPNNNSNSYPSSSSFSFTTNNNNDDDADFIMAILRPRTRVPLQLRTELETLDRQRIAIDKRLARATGNLRLIAEQMAVLGARHLEEQEELQSAKASMEALARQYEQVMAAGARQADRDEQSARRVMASALTVRSGGGQEGGNGGSASEGNGGGGNGGGGNSGSRRNNNID